MCLFMCASISLVSWWSSLVTSTKMQPDADRLARSLGPGPGPSCLTSDPIVLFEGEALSPKPEQHRAKALQATSRAKELLMMMGFACRSAAKNGSSRSVFMSVGRRVVIGMQTES